MVLVGMRGGEEGEAEEERGRTLSVIENRAYLYTLERESAYTLSVREICRNKRWMRETYHRASSPLGINSE